MKGDGVDCGRRMAKKASWLMVVVEFSRAILHDRPARRNFILYVIGAVIT